MITMEMMNNDIDSNNVLITSLACNHHDVYLQL